LDFHHNLPGYRLLAEWRVRLPRTGYLADLRTRNLAELRVQPDIVALLVQILHMVPAWLSVRLCSGLARTDEMAELVGTVDIVQLLAG
jgi:hypothetical protein